MIFISLAYSPWSEKARWALDFSGLEYRSENYTSMVGAPLLRYKMKKFRGPVTVPVLIDGKTILTDSFDIALYADSKHQSLDQPRLIPCEQTAKQWNDLSEVALSIGRYHCVERQLSNSAAQKEILPGFIPHYLRPHFAWLAKSGLKYHLNKYDIKDNQLADYRRILLTLRKKLDGQDYILDEFSYCDIVMALALQYVKPVSHRYSAQGPASARCWSTPELIDEFPDLLEWRDRLYHQYRGCQHGLK